MPAAGGAPGPPPALAGAGIVRSSRQWSYAHLCAVWITFDGKSSQIPGF
jgi:hypothetical protein